MNDELKMIVPTVKPEPGPPIQRAVTQTPNMMKTTSQKKASLLMKYNIGEDFLTKNSLKVVSSAEDAVDLSAGTIDLIKNTATMTAASSAEDIIAHSEYSSTEDISAQPHLAQSVAPPPPPSPPKWQSETPDLTSNEVYGIDEFTTDESSEKKKKYLRRSNDGEIIKFPPVYVVYY